MSGLEFTFRKTLSNALDTHKYQNPNNFAEALSELVSYSEKQLPVIMDTDFVPISFDITKDKQSAVVGGRHGNVGTYDFALMKIIRDEEICKSSVVHVALAADDTQVIILSANYELIVVDFPSYTFAFKIELKPNPTTLKIRPGKDMLYYSNSSPEIFIMQIDKNEEIDDRNYSIKSLPVSSCVNCLDISDDGSLLALALNNGVVQLIHSDKECQLQKTQPHSTNINILCFSENRRFIGAGFMDNTLRV